MASGVQSGGADIGNVAMGAPLNTPGEIDGVFKSLARNGNGAFIVPGDTILSTPSVRQMIIASAAANRIPGLFGDPSFAYEGGLISYGTDRHDPYRQAASYVDFILNGEKPSALPVQQPMKFQFIINLKTAKALGLDLSPTLVGTADEVIE